MGLLIDQNHLPAAFTFPLMTDEQFMDLCSEHPDLSFETTAEGELIVMPPGYNVTGARNSEILRQLGNWAMRDAIGIVTGPDSIYVLPTGARRTPDAAWTLKHRVLPLHADPETGFWHLAPDFVIELKSNTGRLGSLRLKMREWVDSGVQLAWLLDPDTRIVEVYRPNTQPEIIGNAEAVRGEGPLESFTLNLQPVWNPFRSLC